VKLTPSNVLGIVSASLLLLIVGFLAGSVGWRASPSGPTPSIPSPPEPPPRKVGDPDRVRQVLRPGKTYVTHTKGTLHALGVDKDWGLSTAVTINYAFEAQVDREIKSNDGVTVVEVRHFRDVRSLKIDTRLEDLRIELGSAGDFLLAGLGALAVAFPESGAPAAVGLVKALDGTSAKSVLTALRTVGVSPERLAGLDAAAVKVFGQVDRLSGKAVRLTYRDGEGVIAVEPVRGEMTEAERDFHLASVLLSDAFIVPAGEVPVGRQWKVDGRNFANLIDPGLRARTEGEVMLQRTESLQHGPRQINVVGGAIHLDASDHREGRLGRFVPEGSLYYAAEEPYVVGARLSGRAKMEKFSKDHLLFEAHFTHEPTLDLSYSCMMVDTPGGR
jgi:hypothetical protein